MKPNHLQTARAYYKLGRLDAALTQYELFFSGRNFFGLFNKFPVRLRRYAPEYLSAVMEANGIQIGRHHPFYITLERIIVARKEKLSDSLPPSPPEHRISGIGQIHRLNDPAVEKRPGDQKRQDRMVFRNASHVIHRIVQDEAYHVEAAFFLMPKARKSGLFLESLEKNAIKQLIRKDWRHHLEPETECDDIPFDLEDGADWND